MTDALSNSDLPLPEVTHLLGAGDVVTVPCTICFSPCKTSQRPC